MANQPKPGYRAWYQRCRGAALRRLEARHKDEYRTYLAEAQAANPFEPQQNNDGGS